MRQVTESIPAQERLARYRTKHTAIITEDDGSKYILESTRMKIVTVGGIEVERSVCPNKVRREFDPTGAGMDADEMTIFLKLQAKIDTYATDDGEGAQPTPPAE